MNFVTPKLQKNFSNFCQKLGETLEVFTFPKPAVRVNAVVSFMTETLKHVDHLSPTSQEELKQTKKKRMKAK